MTHRDTVYDHGIVSLGENKNLRDLSQRIQGRVPRDDIFFKVHGIPQLAAHAFLVPVIDYCQHF